MIKPIGNKVLVRMPSQEERLTNGVWAPVWGVGEPATVIATADGVTDVGVGDKVILPLHCGDAVIDSGVTYRLVKAGDIMATLGGQE